MIKMMKTVGGIVLLASSLSLFPGTQSHSAENKALLLGVDKAKLFRMEQPASTIIIGNPTIADVSIQDGSLLVFTGKNFGTTNVIILDENDKEIAEFDVSVSSGNAKSMTVFKGASRSSYNCTPTCEKSLSVGDNKDGFDLLKSQMETKMSISKGDAPASDPAGVQ